MSLKNLSVTTKIPKYFKEKLKDSKLNSIYIKFENSLKLKDKFIVGVSGGPDSLALAFLSKVYSFRKNINSEFIIIDHKLRKNSTKEAKLVKSILKKHNINSKILTWNGKKPTSNIQSSARNKRYELFYSFCKKYKFYNIVLGHHLDDLFENFFLRILRGSGLKGLVSLDKKIKDNDFNIFRPLLDIKKRDLEYVAKLIFNFYVNDPSNKDINFKRIKIRNFLDQLQKEGLDKRKFLLTIKNLKYANDGMNFYVNENMNKNTFFSSQKKQLILNNDFFQKPDEVVFRSFSRAIQIVGKKYYSSRGKKLKKVLDQIQSKSFLKATLGGCIIQKVSQTVILSKEH